MGVASCAQVRLGAVNLTTLSALTRVHEPYQVCYSKVCVVRDEEANASGAGRDWRQSDRVA
jgi:hypothetical protein